MTKQALEQHIREVAAAHAFSPDERMLSVAVEKIGARLDALAAWPSEMGDVQITWLSPTADQPGYAGATVPNPLGGDHPKIGMLYRFTPDGNVSRETETERCVA